MKKIILLTAVIALMAFVFYGAESGPVLFSDIDDPMLAQPGEGEIMAEDAEKRPTAQLGCEIGATLEPTNGFYLADVWIGNKPKPMGDESAMFEVSTEGNKPRPLDGQGVMFYPSPGLPLLEDMGF